ncbi:hypothetical protein L7F22_016981 [Adiantum nelumboides]|nr:hypothetical protein [Adiantum nelumboides]
MDNVAIVDGTIDAEPAEENARSTAEAGFHDRDRNEGMKVGIVVQGYDSIVHSEDTSKISVATSSDNLPPAFGEQNAATDDVTAADSTINAEPAEENACSTVEAGNTAAASSADVPAAITCGTREDADEQWEEQFLDSLDKENLFEVMMAAHYLDIPGLEHLTCVRVGEEMRGMTIEEACTIFNLPFDFTPEEDAAIRRQTDMLLEFLHRLNIRE